MMERSYLFVPADRPERIAKAQASGAHAVIVDLEDAVAASRKAEARAALQAWLQEQPAHRDSTEPNEGASASAAPPLIVRINADPALIEADLALCAASPLVQSVILPKAETVAQVARVSSALRTRPVIALIESALGFENRLEIARAPGVARLAFGSIDFQADLGITGEDEALLMFRSGLVLASRLAGLPSPIDGVTADLQDEERLKRETRRSRELGFGAKLCIHPRQVPLVNQAFEPTAAEREWAQRVLQAWEASGGAAVAVGGQMVDRPVLLRAQAILA